MKVNQLIANNINKLDTAIPFNKSFGIAGLSGSGKTTFCQTIGEESKKRWVSLLPKAEYQYLSLSARRLHLICVTGKTQQFRWR
ncbi:hypothetical protein B4147_2201 [Bacillus wiedmannii]|uniref:UvrABC system protein A n=1 Tax=Bacillus wiedmannii TaxID=1890302 RepID=A0A0G8BZM9_9BACI|nr:hypothetical protein B4147_2201 [Bacillus wiedmannii]